MKCRFCDSVNIHPSRWQRGDLFWLFFFRLPMRCHDCIRRDHRNLFLVLRARSADRERRRKEDLEDDAADRNDTFSSQKS